MKPVWFAFPLGFQDENKITAKLLQSKTFNQVHHNANTVAHTFIKLAFKFIEEKIWIKEYPQNIHTLTCI